MGEEVSKTKKKKSCSVLWTVPDNILTYFFFCEIAAPPTVQWRESSLDAQYRKPRKRDRGDSMHHQITSSSHHPHPESPFKSKSGKNTDLHIFFSYLTSGQHFYWSKFDACQFDFGLDQTFQTWVQTQNSVLKSYFWAIRKLFRTVQKCLILFWKQDRQKVCLIHVNNLREFLSEYTSSDISRYFTFSGKKYNLIKKYQYLVM